MALRVWVFTFFVVIVGQALAAKELAPATKGTRVGSQAMLIHVDHGRLTVKLQEVPLERVLKEIERRAAIEISIRGVLTEDISMEFQNLPLEEGLQRLLRGYGWMLFYAGSASQSGGSLERVIVVPAGEGGRLGQREGVPGPGEETSVRAVAARLDREEVKSPLDMYLHGPNARARRDAFRGLMDAVEVEDFELLIGMLQDENVQPAEWEVALAPLSEVITSGERRFILSSLQDQAAREKMVKMLESYLIYKTREEAKTR